MTIYYHITSLLYFSYTFCTFLYLFLFPFLHAIFYCHNLSLFSLFLTFSYLLFLCNLFQLYLSIYPAYLSNIHYFYFLFLSYFSSYFSISPSLVHFFHLLYFLLKVFYSPLFYFPSLMIPFLLLVLLLGLTILPLKSFYTLHFQLFEVYLYLPH